MYNLTGESAEFEQFLYDPSIPKNKKVPALNAILEKMEVSDVTKHFFGKVHPICCHSNAFVGMSVVCMTALHAALIRLPLLHG